MAGWVFEEDQKQKIIFSEMFNRLFDTYDKFLMPHGCHIYVSSSEMFMYTMCAYPPSKYALTHCKCVLPCCYKYPYIDFTGK